jgi:hypothetical protein
MQNSLTFGEIAKTPWRLHIPRKEQDEVKAPNIKSINNRGFTRRDEDLTQTERSELYTPFIIKPIKKKHKRVTCLQTKCDKYEKGCWSCKE